MHTHPLSKLRRTWTVAAAFVAVATVSAACGGGTSTDGGNDAPKTLTYWASNQGATIEVDKQTLAPELTKFEQQYGIKVKLEVVPWTDLLNRILAATTSGQGPDVLNIGNTWSASLQATGGLLPFDQKTFDQIGGKNRFLPSALASTGAPGKDPAAVPLYSMAYALYYNKKMFADAGIKNPPATWDELVEDGKKLTKDGKHGLAIEGASIPENSHHAFVFGQQYGADFFDASGKAQFDTPQAVTAVKAYIDLMAKEKIAAPGNAEYSANQSISDFAKGKVGMLMWQTAESSLIDLGMKPGEWGVVPVPQPAQPPAGGKKVTSLVARINIAVFKSSKNQDGALKFVKFMTSDEEQKILNKAYKSLPPVMAAQQDPAFSSPDLEVFKQILANTAAPLPMVPQESQFETLVGEALKDLFADAAAGKPVTEESVKAKLTEAQQKMAG